jgi:hypothetical protein
VTTKPIEQYDTILELRKDTAALKELSDLEEMVDVPPERGGVYFSDWEREFIKSVREQHDRTLEFSEKQRMKIKDIWHAVDLRKRERPDEKPANLFSKLSPARQAEMRERAAKVRLPWEK